MVCSGRFLFLLDIPDSSFLLLFFNGKKNRKEARERSQRGLPEGVVEGPAKEGKRACIGPIFVDQKTGTVGVPNPTGKQS
jgi:hypothetical protein